MLPRNVKKKKKKKKKKKNHYHNDITLAVAEALSPNNPYLPFRE